MPSEKNTNTAQVKICGLTRPQEAQACADMGASAIGLMFYPPSPRNLSVDQASVVAQALPEHVIAVGVFVDPTWDLLTQAITQCRLKAVQLHGNESVELIAKIKETFQIKVIKALFMAKKPNITAVAGFSSASAYLIECGKGRLPGGNAMAWNWSAVADFAKAHPTILAGGLTPDNVEQAIAACLPDAVDVSSGLESAPGRKDLKKVARFLKNVHQCVALYRNHEKQIRPIFG